jgi:prepilin-type processing-associated H-X9-DG protein/prepilin-type N-terminal cleavage/methylation domain-containing protein
MIGNGLNGLSSMPVGRTLSTRRATYGFTILELLVCIVILAIILGLLLPAVAQARNHARSLHCRNNLKEVTLALHLYHDQWSVLPPGTNRIVLPFSWAIGTVLPGTESHYQSRPLFLCPSDPVSAAAHATRSAVNYVPNLGGPNQRAFDSWNSNYGPWETGIVVEDEKTPLVTFAAIRDGLSNTAAISETLWLQPAASWRRDGRPVSRYSWSMFSSIDMNVGSQSQFWQGHAELIRQCESFPRTDIPIAAADELGNGPVWSFVYYSHWVLPNRGKCQTYEGFYFRDGTLTGAFWPASSEHLGTVNIAFADGHVSVIADNIDKRVYQALGTIDGDLP